MPRKKKEEKLEDVEIRDIKKELEDYAKIKVDEQVKLATKKLIRHKNAVIIRRDLLIIILIILCLFLCNRLYNMSDISININKNSNEVSKEKVEENTNDVSYEEYNYLLEKINISEESSYIKEFYNGNLDDEVKNYIAFSNISNDKIIDSNNTVYIEKSDIENVYNDIFTSIFNPSNFKYNNSTFNYLEPKEIFISDKYIEEESNIQRKIIDVNNEGDNLSLTVLEYIIKNNKLYNVKTGKEISKYNNNIDKFVDDLTTIKYIFKNIDGKYKLDNVSI